MKIEKIEKVILTEEEFNIIGESLDIIEKIYDICEEKGELEKQTENIVDSLNDFINNAEIEL